MAVLGPRLAIGWIASAALVFALLPLTPERGQPAAAAEPRLKGRIVYASKVDGDYELFLMRADGSRRRRLTNNDVDDLNPAWAPGGRRIVFEREGKGGFGFANLFILSLNTDRVRTWVVTPNGDEGEPAWSPNGKWIAFRGHGGDDGSSLVAQRVDRSETRVIASHSYNDVYGDPAWSPDGRELAFVESSDSTAQIYTAEFCCSRGNQRNAVTRGGPEWDWKQNLDWAPVGNCLLYSVKGKSSLYTVSASGGEPGAIYKRHGAQAGSYSPDGRHIVLTSDAKGSYDIYIIRNDGSETRRITSSRADEIDPAWFGGITREPKRPRCVGPSPSPSRSPSPSPSLTLPPA